MVVNEHTHTYAYRNRDREKTSLITFVVCCIECKVEFQKNARVLHTHIPDHQKMRAREREKKIVNYIWGEV